MLRHARALALAASSLAIFAVVLSAAAPEVLYETAIPGYTIPHARDVAVAGDGSAYLIGSAYDDGTHLDVLVAKIGPGGKPVWTQYVVSENHNYATGIAYDGAGGVWVTGWTDSEDFPVVNPMDGSLTGFRDAFLMKLDAADGTILYSTFIGGDYTDRCEAIVLNDAGEIYLTGRTGSTDFPVTPDAYQGEPSFPLYVYSDAFIMKLSPSGDEILYATYFGGLFDDEAQRIVLDSGANMIIAGNTDADDFPLVDAVDNAPNDLFISKLSADGSTLLFSTYFGGEDLDRLGGMTIDADDMLYLVGSTRSVAFPTTPGAYAETFVGEINGCEVPFGADYNCEDLFVTKLATDGSGIDWSTYLGGTRVDEGRGVAVDPAGRVYVTGYTSSDDFPPDGMDFGAEIIVSRFDPTGSDLEFTHSVDSGSANRGNGIAVDAEGRVTFTGTLGVPASIYVSKLGTDLIVAADDPMVTPAGLTLATNVPNPFNPRTAISYAVPEGSAARVRLDIFDTGGRLVRRLVDTIQDGTHTAVWDARDDRGTLVTSGTYYYRLAWEDHHLAGRMSLVR